MKYFTVRELIEELEKQPEHATVLVKRDFAYRNANTVTMLKPNEDEYERYVKISSMDDSNKDEEDTQ